MRQSDYAALAPTSGLQPDPKNPPETGAVLVWNGKNYVPGTITATLNGAQVSITVTPSVTPT
jgi:hypothetical protein